jgi:hypothetical protein
MLVEQLECGTNFRQAQGVEKQCPYARTIEIIEALTGKGAETLTEGEQNNRNAFCHFRIDVKRTSGRINETVQEAILPLK